MPSSDLARNAGRLGDASGHHRFDHHRVAGQPSFDNWLHPLASEPDGYQAYDRVGGPGLIHVGWWAHARRKFVDAVKVNPQDGEAIQMALRMDARFLVDRHARQQQRSAGERAAMRREDSQSWVEEIHSRCRNLGMHVLPKSALGEAVNYTLNLWPKLQRCFDRTEVELSNNVAENSMRPVALGRNSFGGGVLPPAGRAGERLLARDPARHEPKNALRGRSVHSGSVEGSRG